MEDGDGGDLTPFWVQNTTNSCRAYRFLRHISAAFFSSGLVVLLLLVTAVFFLVFVVPSSLSFSAQIFKPNSVKKSWDSLNVLLVLVAVVFGFLSRNKNEDKYYSYYDEFQASPSKQNEFHKSSNSNPSTPNWYKYNYATTEGPKSNLSNSSQWFEYSDYETKLEHKNPILARNSNSYPDLRDFSTANWSYGDYYPRRYYDDDIHVDSGRAWNQDLALDPGQVKLHRRHRSLEGVEHLRALPQNKTVIVDTLPSRPKGGENFAQPEMVAAAASSPDMEESAATGSELSSTKLNKDFEPLEPDTAQKLPQPHPTAVESLEFTENPELTYERVGRKKERLSRKTNKISEPKDLVTTPPPPQGDPPRQSPPRQKSTHRKRGGVTGSSTKYFLNSLYHKKKKKQRQKSIDILDPLLHEAQVTPSSQLPPPSHPPPPPPPSVFQNMFSSKKQKRKRTITVTLAPQSPSPILPPPPPPAAASEPEPTSRAAPATTHMPPKATKMTSFDRIEETSNSGGDSPLNRIPPPPPPPLAAAFFKGPAWKFVVQGDYVRVNSSTSSRSGSPDTDDRESDFTPSALDAEGVATFHPSPLFCPSPDVNTKAESFITNFRAKLQLEKIHSMKKKDVGLSGLGPGPGPSQFSLRN